MHKMTEIPPAGKQMIVVLTDSVTATQGQLYRFEKSAREAVWKQTEVKIPVCVGSKGLGWGLGLHEEKSIPGFPVKKEGDGKSPAGKFGLTCVFGFAPPEQQLNLKMPYLHVTDMLECIDDVNSVHYNQILDRAELEKTQKADWHSSEKMRSVGYMYEIGVVVEHNTPQIQNGGGSCIFMHVWSRPGSTTAGCTAMDVENMRKIAFWLDKSKDPVLVQLTRELYFQLKSRWNLPEIEE